MSLAIFFIQTMVTEKLKLMYRTEVYSGASQPPPNFHSHLDQSDVHMFSAQV